jgi:hypothetical protein
MVFDNRKKIAIGKVFYRLYTDKPLRNFGIQKDNNFLIKQAFSSKRKGALFLKRKEGVGVKKICLA